MNFVIRAATVADRPALWVMLMHAAHESSLIAVNSNPELARYVEDWPRTREIGAIAEIEGAPVGAAWLRLWSGKNRGYGYLSDEIPELAIAVLPNYRAQGLGTDLLKRLLEMAKGNYPAICLSIRADNPALRLYQRLGFRPVSGTRVVNRTGGQSFTMSYYL